MNLTDFSAEAKYAVFDDFDFEYFPNKKAWWGAQSEFTATDKYLKKKNIKFGKPIIYICNPDQDPRKHKLWNNWFSDNCICIELLNDCLLVRNQ